MGCNVILINTYRPTYRRWTGSNTNPNNNDGQGKAGTDRTNVVLLSDNEWGKNYPSLLDKSNLLGMDKTSLNHLAVLDNSKRKFTLLHACRHS